MDKDRPLVDKNDERRLLIMRAMQIKDVLRGRIFSFSVDAGDFEYRPGQAGTDEENMAEWRKFRFDDFWGERELYCQFRQTVTVPEELAGKKVVYDVTCFPFSGWDSSCQQFIAKVNGVTVQGIDHNHTFIFLSECAKAGEKYDIFLNAYFDDNEFRGKSQLRAYLRAYEEDVNALYYDLDTLWEAAHLFGPDDTPRVDIVKAMNEACSIVELNTCGQEEFLDSCRRASEYLHENIYGAKSDVLMSAIGHTHIDVAWRWRLKQTREKACRSFATVLNLMNEYPDYRFMSSQAQLYEYVKNDNPAVYEGIKKAVAAKRWEPEGAMWVESDTNVVSGESLVRQILFGKGFFRDEFGVDNKIVWLPDVFGYSAALPQIMKKSGVDYFMTTKIGWSEYTRFPYDTFRWEGIDGSSVLSHFIPARDNEENGDWHSTYNADINAQTAYYSWRKYSQKNLNKNFLCSFGHGDGGGGPERSFLEKAKRLNEGVPGIPQVKQEFALDFFKRLDKEVGGSRYLPKWRGELYLEYHRGTLTAQARNKKYNRKSEFLMHNAETLSEISSLVTGAPYPRDTVNACWKLILLNQFHDIIPGSSIAPVYEDSKEQYEKLMSDAEEICSKAKRQLIDKIAPAGGSAVVFNTLGFARGGIVEIKDAPDGDFTVYSGDKALPTQRTYDGRLIFAADSVPAKGWKVFTLKNEKCSFAAPEHDLSRAETAEYEICFDKNMNIASLFHKPTGRFVAPEGKTLGEITAYEDRSHVYEAWDIKCYYDEKSYSLAGCDGAEIIEKGPVRTVIRVKRHFGKSPIIQDYVISDYSGRIDICYDIDWKEKNIALKADYPVDVNTDKATFDIQFGNLERSSTENTLADFAQFEVCGHKWADLSDTSFGLTVMNDCKYGWTVKDGHIRPTLLRSAASPNVNQDRERHTFTYALAAHGGSVRTSSAPEKAYELNVPLEGEYAGGKEGTGCGEFSLVSCDSRSVIIETVKKAEKSDSLIIRMYENLNSRVSCSLSFGIGGIKKVSECSLTEEDYGTVYPLSSDNSVKLTFRPFEIKTLKIDF